MTRNQVLGAMDYPNAARANRLNAAAWILAHPESLPFVVEICLNESDRPAEKTAWALEFAFLESSRILDHHLNYLFDHLHQQKKDSMVRALSHICEKLCATYYTKSDTRLHTHWNRQQREQLVEAAFNWLLGPYRVACQVRAMTCLYYLGRDFAWIYPELERILQDNLHKGSPGFKNRGLKILELLRSEHN